VATSTLAVRVGLQRRITTVDPMCPICGNELEDSHHALIRCTMARALREGMRLKWKLPPEADFAYTGNDWLLSLLNKLPERTRAEVIFLFWRTWHHRNNIVHGDGKASIAVSIPFLSNYLESFGTASSSVFDPKGKSLATHEHYTIS
jgi:hypothetical protein